METKNKLLKKIYFNLNNPSSFQSSEKLFKAAQLKNPNITRDIINNWLRQQKTYTQHFPAKLHFKRNPIVSKYIDHNWHADLIEISHPTENDNFKYILMVIDNLSKYGWAKLL